MMPEKKQTEYEVELRSCRGAGLLELVIALAIFTSGGILFALMYIDGVTSSIVALDRTQAILLAEEGLEAVRSIGDKDGSFPGAGTYELALSNSNWQLVDPGNGTDLPNNFRRSITLTESEINGWLAKVEVVFDHPVTKHDKSLKLTGYTSNL